MNLAPILVTVYDRPEHFKRCIESLKLNKYADQSDLFVAIDAPYKEEHAANNKLVIEYAKTITGFKSVYLFIRPENWGRENIFSARREIFEKYDRLIFFEDDNIFSEDFLNFVNSGLEIYKNREDVFSISGYNYPVDYNLFENNETYMWQGYSAWGVGIWRDKWNAVDMNVSSALQSAKNFLKNYSLVYKLNAVANHYLPALLLMQEKQKLHGDGFISLHHFLNNMYSVFPVESRVRNIGHDGSGINCALDENDIYSVQPIYSGISDAAIFNENLYPDNLSNDIIYNHFKTPAYAQLKTFVRLLFHNIGIIKYFKK
jgi:hypothetical protein